MMGFDYGRKRIGVAIGQELTATTQAIDTIAVRQSKPDWDHITRLLEEWKPDLLLIGLPMNMDGTEHDISKAARRFANQLNGRYQLPVELVDERLSSVEAEEIITEARRDKRIKKSQAKRSLDQVAAEIIIRTWLSQ